MRDTSLDEFVGGDDAASGRGEPGEADPGDGGASEQPTLDTDADVQEAAAPAEAAGDSAVPDDADAGPHDVDAPPDQTVPTFAWSADAAACARCGETAARRWREAADLVCSTCKTW